ncbi:MAG: PQQ-binding-like beta-propeller repeat protein [Cyclobacteriaceae bacterium]|nr:PQQ-binding-like beta-propeller repeat protein [Cyclobacteriaceae bacterium]
MRSSTAKFQTKGSPRILVICLLILLAGCGKKNSKLVWNEDISLIGSQSSPRTADLNGDGILDIVMGAGKNEYQHSDQGIVAFDGKTGKLLWQQESPDQVFGSATFYDITGDGIPDILIGGRSPHFKALNGKTGEVLWAYDHTAHAQDSILQYARFNFNNSVLIPDQNNDGLQDLLALNGGNPKADPYATENRFPGVLMVFDIKTGNIIAADTMPDGKESYMAPLCFAQPGSTDYTLIFGTGGETIDGRLYMARLSDLMNQELRNAKVLASEKGHGFIAPPVAADITNDGFLDIVAISHGSSVFAIDGKDQKVLWSQSIKNTECSNSFAVGYFTADDIPDFFTFVSKGQWPNSTGTLQVMMDGKDGRIAYMDSMGCTGFSSPVVYDINGDGNDEAIISINEFDCALGFTGKAPITIENKLVAIDFMKRSVQIIDQMQGFKNIFSTPWIGDLDDDGYLDIVHCQYYHRSDLLSFLGMRIKRIDTPIRVRNKPAWGAFRGSRGDGLFLPVQ